MRCVYNSKLYGNQSLLSKTEATIWLLFDENVPIFFREYISVRKKDSKTYIEFFQFDFAKHLVRMWCCHVSTQCIIVCFNRLAYIKWPRLVLTLQHHILTKSFAKLNWKNSKVSRDVFESSFFNTYEKFRKYVVHEIFGKCIGKCDFKKCSFQHKTCHSHYLSTLIEILLESLACALFILLLHIAI